ncbi:putative magnesium transporter NIPA2 [Curcuma longa]|uniref:putative magnesium transporter NIPA2 n=1 Tax=Curcuma longa TaxID=136217 RepID=UPI003D9F0F74
MIANFSEFLVIRPLNILLTVILGEVANFAAYAFAPAILVTPLGALSIIVSAVLAHFMLNEKLHIFGVLGCILCVVGSVSIVLHAPREKDIESVKEVWNLATEPGFVTYSCLVLFLVAFLIVQLVPRYGQTHMLVYVGICSLMGSLTVMSVKAVSIALKLTFSGMNQFVYYQTWFFAATVAFCCVMQINYLNKVTNSEASDVLVGDVPKVCVGASKMFLVGDVPTLYWSFDNIPIGCSHSIRWSFGMFPIEDATTVY